ncbi:serine hydroxymethyltransferase [bacterium]|nr:serine hydroxymethyltransferase [bacterium]
MDNLEKRDKEIFELIKKEEKRQFESIRLIPSENYVSKAVLEATGSCLTNKYSEGFSGKRYYEGQEIIDQIENLACKRAQELFKTDYIPNVQPYSGSPANLIALLSLCDIGDTIMGMHLSHGGHLTHGWKASYTGKFFNSVQYTVSKETNLIDFEEIRKIAKESKPKVIICGYTAYPREVDFKKFKEIADEIGAFLIADTSHITGLIASSVHQSPFGFADIVTSTSHKTLRGPRGAFIMSKTEEISKKVEKTVIPGLQGGPHNHTTAAMAVAFAEANTENFKNYSKQIIKNAKKLALELTNKGFNLITGGTDNHLILIDTIKSKNIIGKDASLALAKSGIICNANTVPFDTRSPMSPSGIRIGTPAITTLGLKEDDMIIVADFMNKILENYNNNDFLLKTREEVRNFILNFKLDF